MAESYKKLEPRVVWELFEGLAGVPRPSKKEERIRRHVREWAERKGLNCREDAVGNVLIEVDATPGYEDRAVIALQAHLDMVCEKNGTTQHDFDRQGIRLLVDADRESGGPVVRADGTTLGADNGIGVSLALAAAITPGIVHGPLELLFTVDEEDGMTGAKFLSPESFRGRRMLNLDSEEDDTLYIGCAGGCDTNLAWTLNPEAPPEPCQAFRINVGGLRGGHSGGDIHEGRANAIKLLARTLTRASDDSLRLVSLSGGSKRNAIPREATAVVAAPPGSVETVRQVATEVAREAMAESFEPRVVITLEPESGAVANGAASPQDTAYVLAALTAIPSGVLGMHPTVGGLVETSNNISTIETQPERSQVTIRTGMLSRSSSASRMRETLEQIETIGRMTHANVTHGNAYPGWAPDPDSPTLAVCRRTYSQLFGQEPRIAAIHAGLECGVIGNGVGGMDMVSLGPTIRGAHSPDERVYVRSVERTWRFLVSLLSALAAES